MKVALGLVVVVGMIAGIYALNEQFRRDDGASVLHVAEPLSVTVDAQHAEQREIVRTVQAPGEVEAFDEVDISSEVVAKILELPVEEGDRVEKGDLLCRLDDADYRALVLSRQASIAKLNAMLTQAEASLDQAQRDWERIQQVRNIHATSPRELADYRTALVSAEASVEVRRQELVEASAYLQQAREDLDRTVITAPIGGIVSQRFAEEGEVVITGTMNNPGTRIMVVSDLDKMQVRCRIDEEDAPLVEPGQVARIYLQSDTHRSIAGEVLRVGAKGTKQLGRDVVTFETLVLITGDDPRVKPGMTASVEIEVARRPNATVIPIQAVVHRKRRDLSEELLAKLVELEHTTGDAEESRSAASYVRIVYAMEDGKAVTRFITTGINDAVGVEVLGGVGPEDRVITGPYRSLDQLTDGAAIKLSEKSKHAFAKADEENEHSDEQPDPAAEVQVAADETPAEASQNEAVAHENEPAVETEDS